MSGGSDSDDVYASVTAASDPVDLAEALAHEQGLDQDFKLTAGHSVDLFETGVLPNPLLPSRLECSIAKHQRSGYSSDKHDRDSKRQQPVGGDDVDKPPESQDDDS
ncbi:hypothetical protein AAH991_29670 [Microbispora sp. ZYX-F-249]|uniref:Uncharacterized protein n=1 Tax=Microbispora maris TaxID=3144104 RepID=A0ABV0AX88_9ACTN